MTRLPAHKIRGALYGALVGNAFGVPYEFTSPRNLPEVSELAMTPPTGFRRSHPGTPVGTWSDDGALMLALQDSLKVCGSLDVNDYAQRMVNWWRRGEYTPDGRIFDIGIQTRVGLSRFGSGTPAKQAGPAGEMDNGNGALMRALPVAWHATTDAEAVMMSRLQGLPTHGHLRSQMCCALYVLVARRLLEGQSFAAALPQAHLTLLSVVEPAGQTEATGLLSNRKPGRGGGYVLDCLWSAFDCIEETNSFETAIQRAVSLGDDTDTTACVTGGLAGALYGFEGIPAEWLEKLKGKELVDRLLGLKAD